MSQFVEKIKAVPNSIMDIVIGLMNGVKQQVSTSKGAVILLIIIAVIVDILMKGNLGVIGFSIAQAKILLYAVADVLQKGGGSLIAIVIIVFLMKK